MDKNTVIEHGGGDDSTDQITGHNTVEGETKCIDIRASVKFRFNFRSGTTRPFADT